MTKYEIIPAAPASGSAKFQLVENTENFAIPPFAAMRITGVDSESGAYQVAQPDEDGQTSLIIFNGATPIPSSSKGQAVVGFPCTATYNTDVDSLKPAHGEVWGTKAGSWALHKGQAGYVVIGAGDHDVMTVGVCCGCDAAAAATTTTATTGPPCGTCTYTWDNTTKVWTLDTNDCDTGCTCNFPDFCGSNVCDEATINCGNQSTTTTPNCASGTTTTPPPPTTTTTSTPHPCLGTCFWRRTGSAWVMLNSSCASLSGPGSCYCVGKPTDSGTECEIRAGSCGTTTTTTACQPYSVSCTMTCVPGTGWTNSSSVCVAGCCCMIPQDKCCYSWQLIYSWCSPDNLDNCGDQPSPLCDHTTTTTTVACTGLCTYDCVAGAYVYLSDTCSASCGACPAPPGGMCVPGTTTLPCA